MKTQLKLIAGIATLTSLAAISSVTAQQATTTPVGYRTETIKAGVFNLIAADLTEKVSAAGEVTGISATAITDSNADFAASLPAGDTYILKITSGDNAGLVQEVTVTDGNNVAPSQDVSAMVAAGDTYEVRAAKTIGDIFGPANEAGLTGAANDTDADVIWIPDGSGGFTRFYFAQSAFGSGWRQIGDGSGADKAGEAIAYTDAFFVQSRAAADKDVVLVGHVSTTATMVALNEGFNFVSRVFPVAATLGTSGLENVLTKAANDADADVIWIPDGSGGYARFYFAESAFSNGYRQVGDGSGADKAGEPLTSGVIVQRRGAATNAVIQAPGFYANL